MAPVVSHIGTHVDNLKTTTKFLKPLLRKWALSQMRKEKLVPTFNESKLSSQSVLRFHHQMPIICYFVQIWTKQGMSCFAFSASCFDGDTCMEDVQMVSISLMYPCTHVPMCQLLSVHLHRQARNDVMKTCLKLRSRTPSVKHKPKFLS